MSEFCEHLEEDYGLLGPPKGTKCPICELNMLNNAEPFNHPNIDPEVCKRIQESDIAGGAWIDKLADNKTLLVQTQNRTYHITRHGNTLYINGHPKYCPIPTRCRVQGSTWGGSMLKMGFVGIGMHLEFSTDTYPRVTTSAIKDVKEC